MPVATELYPMLIGFIHNGNIKAQMSSLVKNSLTPRRREHLSVANMNAVTTNALKPDWEKSCY